MQVNIRGQFKLYYNCLTNYTPPPRIVHAAGRGAKMNAWEPKPLSHQKGSVEAEAIYDDRLLFSKLGRWSVCVRFSTRGLRLGQRLVALRRSVRH